MVSKTSFILPLALMASCANVPPKVETTSFQKPEIKKTYSRLLVAAFVDSKKLQKQTEENVIQQLNEKRPDLVLLAGHQTVELPMTDDKLNAVAKKNKLDGFLFLVFEDLRRSKELNTPPSEVSKQAQDEYHRQGATYEKGVYTIQVESKVVDYVTGKKAWTNQSVIEAVGVSQVKAMNKSLAEAVAKQLVAGKVLARLELRRAEAARRDLTPTLESR